MKVQMGEFAQGFAWQVIDNDSIVEWGWDEDLRVAREQAMGAAAFWSAHDYERE